MHFVHVNAKYDSLTQALSNKDGLAVLGTLFQVRLVEQSLCIELLL